MSLSTRVRVHLMLGILCSAASSGIVKTYTTHPLALAVAASLHTFLKMFSGASLDTSLVPASNTQCE